MSRIGHHQPAYGDLQGQFRRSYHLEMASDAARVAAIRRALRETLSAGDVFCEVGCGTAIFALEAARLGAKVFAVEQDQKMAEIAKRNIDAAGLGGRIELISGNAAEVSLPERVDVALCEMMSIWAVEEPLVPVANHVRRACLKPEGKLLPLRIMNVAELGYYPFRRHGVSMPAVMPLFTGVPRPHVMTESRVCRTLDFCADVDPDLSVDVEFEAVASGFINCAVLRSVVQVGPGTVFSGSDSLMPPTVVPLEEEVAAEMGSRLRFCTALRARSSLEASWFEVKRLS